MTNEDIARRLQEVARLLEAQRANPYRVAAYQRAAASLRRLELPVAEILEREGTAGLDRLPAIGLALSRSIAELIHTGRLTYLERLRGRMDPVALLASVPGIGRLTATRIHQELGIETLEELEAAAHDGRLDRITGLGAKKLAGIIDSLAARLGRTRATPGGSEPPVEELLDVDAEYRRGVEAGRLPRIAPRRFNPEHLAWLPILHTRRGGRHYTALYSNTARAHQLGRTRDWVVLYSSDDHQGERQYTVVTAGREPLAGQRIVRGREEECARFYAGRTPRGAAAAPRRQLRTP